MFVGRVSTRRFRDIGRVVPMHEKTDITSRRFIAEGHVTFQTLPEMSAETIAVIAQQLRSALGPT
jgi:histidine triad (HIT) family protein